MSSAVASTSGSAAHTPHPASDLHIYSVKEGWVLPKLDPATDMKKLAEHIRDYRNSGGTNILRGIDNQQKRLDYLLGRSATHDIAQAGFDDLQGDSELETDDELLSERARRSRKRKAAKGEAVRSSKKASLASNGERDGLAPPDVGWWWRVKEGEMQSALEKAVDEKPGLVELVPSIAVSSSNSDSKLLKIIWKDKLGKETTVEVSADQDLFEHLRRLPSRHAPSAMELKVMVDALRKWLADEPADGLANAQRILRWLCLKHLAPEGSKLLIPNNQYQELSDKLAVLACRLLFDKLSETPTSANQLLRDILQPHKPKITLALRDGLKDQSLSIRLDPGYGTRFPRDKLGNWIVPVPVVTAAELAELEQQAEIEARVTPSLQAAMYTADMRERYYLDLLRYAILKVPYDSSFGDSETVKLFITRIIAAKTGKQHMPKSMVNPFMTTTKGPKAAWNIYTKIHGRYFGSNINVRSVQITTPPYDTQEEMETEVCLGMQMLLDVMTTDLNTDIVLLKIRIFDHLFSRAVNKHLQGTPEAYEELKQSIGGWCKHPNKDGWHFCCTGHFVPCEEHCTGKIRCKACTLVMYSDTLKSVNNLDYEQLNGILRSLKREDDRYMKQDIHWLAKILDKKEHKDLFLGTVVRSRAQIVKDTEMQA